MSKMHYFSNKFSKRALNLQFWGYTTFCSTTLEQPVLLWPFLALSILLLVYFGVNLFGANFTKIIFFWFSFFNFF